MSLINDALKKAREAERKNPPKGPSGAPPTPVPMQPPPPGGKGKSIRLIVAVVLLVSGIAVFVSSRGGDDEMDVAVNETVPEVVAPEPATSPAEPASPVAKVEKPVAPEPVVEKPVAASAPEPKKVEPIPVKPEPVVNPVTMVAETTEPIVKPSLPPENVFQDMPLVDRTAAMEDEAAKLASLLGKTPTEPVVEKPVDPGVMPVAKVEEKEAEPLNFSAPKPSAVRPEGQPVASFPLLKIQGIFYSKSNPTVIIDRRLMKVGDEIAGAKVIEIQPQSVVLEYEGQRKTLSL